MASDVWAWESTFWYWLSALMAFIAVDLVTQYLMLYRLITMSSRAGKTLAGLGEYAHETEIIPATSAIWRHSRNG
ncbi:hypothetical protein AO269_25105 [Pseudomonas putida]|nr:hypothetical protein AO269_25105 [Pseudomonas putida]